MDIQALAELIVHKLDELDHLQPMSPEERQNLIDMIGDIIEQYG